MTTWKIEPVGNGIKNLNIKNAILIEGLPGIGNVGKIAVDFMVDEVKAEKVYSMFSHSLPHSVFVNEKNLLELPMIDVYYKKLKNQDVFFLTGDVQPMDEVSCYMFCETMLDKFTEHNCKEVITMGGIGLNEIPVNPKVYCTSTNKAIVNQYKKHSKVNDQLYGVVGPIIGVSGVMVGLAGKRKMPGACLLAETYGHPMYVGVAGAKELVKVLSNRLGIKIDLKKMDKEAGDLNTHFSSSGDLVKLNKNLAIAHKKNKDINYIG